MWRIQQTKLVRWVVRQLAGQVVKNRHRLVPWFASWMEQIAPALKAMLSVRREIAFCWMIVLFRHVWTCLFARYFKAWINLGKGVNCGQNRTCSVCETNCFPYCKQTIGACTKICRRVGSKHFCPCSGGYATGPENNCILKKECPRWFFLNHHRTWCFAGSKRSNLIFQKKKYGKEWRQKSIYFSYMGSVHCLH